MERLPNGKHPYMPVGMEMGAEIFISHPCGYQLKATPVAIFSVQPLVAAIPCWPLCLFRTINHVHANHVTEIILWPNFHGQAISGVYSILMD
jgi:hypothetical protein